MLLVFSSRRSLLTLSSSQWKKNLILKRLVKHSSQVLFFLRLSIESFSSSSSSSFFCCWRFSPWFRDVLRFAIKVPFLQWVVFFFIYSLLFFFCENCLVNYATAHLDTKTTLNFTFFSISFLIDFFCVKCFFCLNVKNSEDFQKNRDHVEKFSGCKNNDF